MTDSDLATLRTECDALKEQLQAEKIVSQEHWDAYEKAEAERDALQQQLDEAREIVARMNNTVLGSYGYFTSPSCVDAIDDLKASANRHWNEKQAAEAKSARLRAVVPLYTQHRLECAKWKDPRDGSIGSYERYQREGCTCGLDKLLAGDANHE